MSTNVGTVDLSLRLNDTDLLKQLDTVAKKAGDLFSRSMSKLNPSNLNIDFTSVTNEIKKMSASLGDAIKNQAGAIDGLSDYLARETEQGISEGATEGKKAIERAISNVSIPKIKGQLGLEDLKQLSMSLEGQLEHVSRKAYQAEDSMKRAAAALKDASGSDVSKLQSEMDKAAQSFFKFEQNAISLGAKLNAVQAEIKGLERASEAPKKLADSSENAASSMQRLSNEAEKTSQSLQKADKAQRGLLGGLTSGLGKMARFGLAMMGIRSVMLGIRRLTQSIGQNFQIMARNSGSLAAQLQGITAATDQMKGAFAAAAAPLVQAVLPALQKVVEWATKAFNAIAIFFAKISGKKTVQIAVGSTKQYAKALGGVGGAANKSKKGLKDSEKAAEKLKRSLAGFDELEILSFGDKMKDNADKIDDAAGAGAGGIGETGPIFETINIDDTAVGQFIDKMIGHFKRLWKVIENSKSWKALQRASKKSAEIIGKHWDKAVSRVSKSWKENSKRMSSSVKEIFKAWDGALAGAIEHVFEPMITGAIATGLDIGASLLDNIITGAADLLELGEVIMVPFYNSISNFWEKHGPEVEALIRDTWETISEIVTGIIDGIGKVFHVVFGGIIKWFREKGPEIEALWTDVWETIHGIVGPIWNTMLDLARHVFGGMKRFFERIAPPIRDVLVQAFEFVWTVVQVVWPKIKRLAETIFGALKKFWDKWGEGIKRLFDIVWDQIGTIFETALNIIKRVLAIFTKAFKGDWKGVWEEVKGLFSDIWNGIKRIFSNTTKALGIILEGLGFDVDSIFGGIKRTFGGLIDFITGVFTGNWKRAWEGVKNIFGGIWEAMKGLFKTPINWIIGKLNTFLRHINKIKIPDWVPKWMGGGKGFNFTEIPMLAKGGIIDQPTLAIAGEAGKEAVLPLERNTGWMDMLAQKIIAAGGGGVGGDINITMPVYLDNGTLLDEIEISMDRRGRLRNKPALA